MLSRSRAPSSSPFNSPRRLRGRLSITGLNHFRCALLCPQIHHLLGSKVRPFLFDWDSLKFSTGQLIQRFLRNYQRYHQITTGAQPDLILNALLQRGVTYFSSPWHQKKGHRKLPGWCHIPQCDTHGAAGETIRRHLLSTGDTHLGENKHCAQHPPGHPY